MKKLKRYAPVDLTDAEGLYETTIDRWSRRAKHHFSQSELAHAGNQTKFEIGECVIYEGNTTVVKIPQGPHNSVGIMLQGHLTMVHENKISKVVTEGAISGAMGNVISVPAINRMMQLAGVDNSTANESTIMEDASGDMLSKMVQQAANMPQYKGNEEAARLYTIGALLSAIGKTIQDNPPQTVSGRQKLQTLNALTAMGVDLIKTSQTMTNPNQPAIPNTTMPGAL